MKHIETIQKPCLKNSLAHGGCGECQASCQSACKTSCTVANQSCANKETATCSRATRASSTVCTTGSNDTLSRFVWQSYPVCNRQRRRRHHAPSLFSGARVQKVSLRFI